MLWAQVMLSIWMACDVIASIHASIRVSRRREWPRYVPWLTLAAYTIILITAACAGAFSKIIGWPS